MNVRFLCFGALTAEVCRHVIMRVQFYKAYQAGEEEALLIT